MSNPERTVSRVRSSANIGAARHQSILTLIERGNVIAVGEIAQRFGVSPETIRRDIRSLEQEGLLRRVHGGAIATRAPGVNARAPIAERVDIDRDAKILAANAALPLFEDGMNVFIGASSTMMFLAEALARSGKNLTVTTNMIDVAVTLAPRLPVTLTGGTVNAQSRAIGGSETLRALEDRVFDVSVIGASALDFNFGFFGATRGAVDMARVVAERSTVTAIAMHRGKFDRTDSHIVLPLRSVAVLATDAEPDREHRAALEAAGIQILTPQPDTHPARPSVAGAE
jgi:DeoR/GlpR family transcriptional regulator of sugar metabolism